MKAVRFIGSAKDDLSAFPKSARIRAGHELFLVQVGREPDDWKPMTTVRYADALLLSKGRKHG